MNTQRQSEDLATRILAWIKLNRRNLMGVAAVVALVAGGFWFALSAKQRREAFAARALTSARAAVQAGNLPLAASDLSRLVLSYGGTQAADEATILLARVRLTQGDAQTAANELRAAIAEGMEEQFLPSAHGLLGGALEQLGQSAAAGDAYSQAARVAWYDHLSAHYLNEAGRAYAAAGDTSRATQTYEQLLNEYSESPAATEARVRLAELRPSTLAVGS